VNAPTAQRLLAKLVYPALPAILVALVAAAWLALFTIVPLELTPPRVR
jgi:hypothetical protein